MANKTSKIAGPAVFTIFGITGDLTQRKLLPALYNLQDRGYLPDKFFITGFARRDWNDDYLREIIRKSVQANVQGYKPEVLEKLLKNVHYVRGDFGDKQGYCDLQKYIAGLEKKSGAVLEKIYYLAVPPSNYPAIFHNFSKSKLNRGRKLRLLIEKPFGHNLESAKALTKDLLRHFKEEQIYRIDHYLGKAPVDNILSFRFANGIIEHLWSAEHIDNIQISIMEDIGIETRGNFYEETGALLDVIQNHAMQLLALACMPEPKSLGTESVRDKRFELLKSARIADLVRGQYGEGQHQGKGVPAYRQENNVAPDSKIETFIAAKFQIDTKCWRGVPIYVRAGKRMDRKYTDINVQFKQPHMRFLGDKNHPLLPNVLAIRIQPEESISLRLMANQPLFKTELQPVQMDFCYDYAFGNESPEAYERIIFEALRGNQTMFVRSDSIQRQWEIVEPILRNRDKYKLNFYEAGSVGPEAQNALLKKDNRKWISGLLTGCPFHPKM